MTGLSVSLCIKDIIEGRMPEDAVERIVAGTKFDDSSINHVVEVYRQSYWRQDPVRGEAILRRLYAEGKIDQPRTRGEAPPDQTAPGYPWIE